LRSDQTIAGWPSDVMLFPVLGCSRFLQLSAIYACSVDNRDLREHARTENNPERDRKRQERHDAAQRRMDGVLADQLRRASENSMAKTPLCEGQTRF